MRPLLAFLAIALLPGCDKLSGEADRKVADGEAVGFACRVSGMTPGACMSENDGYSPSNILDGWRFADEDIKAGKIDPTMRNSPAVKMQEMESKTPDESSTNKEPETAATATDPAEDN